MEWFALAGKFILIVLAGVSTVAICRMSVEGKNRKSDDFDDCNATICHVYFTDEYEPHRPEELSCTPLPDSP